MIAVNKTRDTSYLECDPDVRLMMRVREGDEDAANELTRQYHDYVQHTINYLLRGSQSAADLTQEVFLRVFRASSRYEPRAKFSTWLFTIVNNVVSNERRRLRKRREHNIVAVESDDPQYFESVIGPVSKTESPARSLEMDEQRQVVHQAIAQLIPRQRDAIEFFYFQKLNCEAIATRMRISSVATRSLLHRARASLRRSLESDVVDG